MGKQQAVSLLARLFLAAVMCRTLVRVPGVLHSLYQVRVPWWRNPSFQGYNCSFVLSRGASLSCLTCDMPVGFWREHSAFQGYGTRLLLPAGALCLQAKGNLGQEPAHLLGLGILQQGRAGLGLPPLGNPPLLYFHVL